MGSGEHWLTEMSTDELREVGAVEEACDVRTYYDDYYQTIQSHQSRKMASRRAASAGHLPKTGGRSAGSPRWNSWWIRAGLSRGRSYARKGQVLSIEETKDGDRGPCPGFACARRTKSPSRLPRLTDAEWDKVIDALAEQAIFTAQLLAGEMPQDIEQAFEAGQGQPVPRHARRFANRLFLP